MNVNSYQSCSNSRAATLLKKQGLAQMFPCEFCEIFKNTFLKEHLKATASKWRCYKFKVKNKETRTAPISFFNVMTPRTRNVNWTYLRRSEGIEVIFWMSYIRPSYVVCARWLWTTTWYSVLFGKITNQKIWENTAHKRKFYVKNIFSKYDQIHRRLQIRSHLLKIYLMENFAWWYLTIGI